MKKIVIALVVTALSFFTLIFTVGHLGKSSVDPFQVAMVTDFADVDDASFNQTCYEGAKEWSNKNNIKFNYYKPTSNSLEERLKSITLAIDRGYNMILCPGYAFGPVIAEVAPKHPEVKFLGLDITEDDFPEGYEMTENVTIYNYYEHVAGYLAGYGVVKEGFRRLGFLGGMESKAVKKFGYGYIQGIDAAAKELKEHVEIQYVYAGQYYGDSEIHKYIDNWYKVENTEIVFSCGASVYTSVALAAKENDGYMIGVDTNQAPVIDRDYGEGICITSAMKCMKQTIIEKLDDYYYRQIWEEDINYLGLISSEDLEKNYVQLPLDDWRMKNFTVEDYRDVVKGLLDGTKEISGEVHKRPTVSEYTTVEYKGSIK